MDGLWIRMSAVRAFSVQRSWHRAVCRGCVCSGTGADRLFLAVLPEAASKRRSCENTIFQKGSACRRTVYRGDRCLCRLGFVFRGYGDTFSGKWVYCRGVRLA